MNPETLNLVIHTSNVHTLAIKNIVNAYIYLGGENFVAIKYLKKILR